MFTGIAIAFGGLLALLLLTPIGLELQVGDPDLAQAAAESRMRLTWARLVSIDLPPASKRRSRPRSVPARRKRPGAPAALPRIVRLIRSEGLLAATARLLVRLISATHPRDLRVQAALGLEDPADTGQLWAALGPVSAILWSASRGAVAVEPDFSEPRAAVHARGRFTIVPGQLIWILLSFALSPAVLRAVRAASRR